MCDSTLTLSEVLHLLRSEHADLLDAVVDGRYSFWIGSGVSRERVPGVKELLSDLLILLYGESEDPTDPACPYVGVIREALGIIHRDPAQYVDRHPEDWGDLDDIVGLLSGHYDRVLGLHPRVDGDTVSLTYDILRLHDRYSEPGLEPDAEHRLIAALMFEGVVTRALTTNWDPLIERAAKAMRDSDDAGFSVIAHADDIHGMRDRFLLKIHGCADLARLDPARYRPYLVATRNEIQAWGKSAGSHSHTVPLRGLAVEILRRDLVLFLGLSGNDDNLLGVANEARIERGTPYPPSPPKVAFVSDRLTDLHRDILRQIHDEGRPDFVDVEHHAVVRPCAKPLLAAIFAHSIRSKAEAIALHAERDPVFPEYLEDILHDFIELAEDHLTATFDAIEDPTERWRRFATEFLHSLASFTALYRRQSLPKTDQWYETPVPEPRPQIIDSEEVKERGLHWLLLTIGALVAGHHEGRWVLSTATVREPCHLLLNRPRGAVRVFIMRESVRGRIQLEEEFGDVAVDPATLLIYTQELEPKRRKPLASIMRTTPSGGMASRVGEVWISDLASRSDDVESFFEALYLELAAEAA